MSSPFLGEIRLFGGNFAPQGWMLCNGQLLNISQYTALFSLLGTTFGGNGSTTFGLPDLQGRIPVGQGQGSGLSNYVLGEAAGSEQVTITSATMATHNHTLNVANTAASTNTLGSNILPGIVTAPGHFYATNTGSPLPTFGVLANGTISMSTDQGLPHDNIMPSLCVTYIIALQGVYPTRN